MEPIISDILIKQYQPCKCRVYYHADWIYLKAVCTDESGGKEKTANPKLPRIYRRCTKIFW